MEVLGKIPSGECNGAAIESGLTSVPTHGKMGGKPEKAIR